jgi:hypothetical protein
MDSNKMRLLPLDEEDTFLFDSQLNRTLYIIYRDNTDSFTLMWEQQVREYFIIWETYCYLEHNITVSHLL